jgi:signal transduction histidine kinase/CheY-like chemotaxis protein
VKPSQVIVLMAVLLASLAWVWLSGVSGVSDAARSLEADMRALDASVIAESELHRDVLSARAGMLRNYDPLVREERDLRAAVDRLRMTSADQEIAAAGVRLASLVARQEQWIEQFKSDNALLQNSLAYFELFSTSLSQQAGALLPKVSALNGAMLHLTLDTSPAVTADVEDRLAGIPTTGLPTTDSDLVRGLVTHGRMLLRVLPATDNALKALFAVPSDPEQNRIRETILKRQRAAEMRATHSRYLLVGISLILVVLLLNVGARLRSRARALRQRAALEHLIAGISTRFISARPHEIASVAEHALRELAHYVRADRAYFHASPRVAGRPAFTFSWCSAGVELSPQWPQQAMALACGVQATASGTREIRAVEKHAVAEERSVLQAAGVRSWLCVPVSSGDCSTAIIAFDTVRDRAMLSGSESGLLRMAVDAFTSATHGACLEHEQVRLHSKLQQARRMEIIGALTSGIAHNFNNIIGAILGYAETAQTYLPPQARATDNLTEIRRAGDRARDLVQQILTFGRRRAARRAQISVRALLSESKSLLDATLPKHAQVVIHELSPKVLVSGQGSQLQQVILNLCNNAAQAMDAPGNIDIEVSVRQVTASARAEPAELPPGNYAVISVTDPGRGMDEATLERIFEPFFTTRLEGNGLGLATVREIVLEHGGTVHVRSAPRTGTRFDVWLPTNTSRNEPPRLDASDTEVRGNGAIVLVLEADRTRLLRHEEILAALGYEPAGFTEPEQAQAACRAEPAHFDAALLCTHQHNLRACLEQAAMLQTCAPGLPLILATRSAGEWSASELAEAGIAEIIHQPFSSVELASALYRCVSAGAAESHSLHNAA